MSDMDDNPHGAPRAGYRERRGSCATVYSVEHPAIPRSATVRAGSATAVKATGVTPPTGTADRGQVYPCSVPAGRLLSIAIACQGRYASSFPEPSTTSRRAAIDVRAFPLALPRVLRCEMTNHYPLFIETADANAAANRSGHLLQHATGGRLDLFRDRSILWPARRDRW
jgi:hypothetical protein